MGKPATGKNKFEFVRVFDDSSFSGATDGVVVSDAIGKYLVAFTVLDYTPGSSASIAVSMLYKSLSGSFLSCKCWGVNPTPWSLPKASITDEWHYYLTDVLSGGLKAALMFAPFKFRVTPNTGTVTSCVIDAVLMSEFAGS